MHLFLKMRRLRVVAAGIAIFVVAVVLINRVLSVPLRSQTNLGPLGGFAPSSSSHGGDSGPIEGNEVSSQVLKMAQVQLALIEQRAKTVAAADEQQLLKRAFKRCDGDASGWLSFEEAESCISQQVALHLTQAIRENFFIFTAIDLNPRNGAVSWTEHVTHFLRSRGYDQPFIDQHIHSLKGLTREEKESIMRDKASWSEAARSDPDALSLDEFLSFRHPESSHATILGHVEELLAELDADGDGALSRAEYLTASEPQLQQRTERQFADGDEDRDGKLDRKELLLYRDPRHPHHSRLEAEQLFAAADTDVDGHLTLPELLRQSRLFAASKMVDAASSFHNEF